VTRVILFMAFKSQCVISMRFQIFTLLFAWLICSNSQELLAQSPAVSPQQQALAVQDKPAHPPEQPGLDLTHLEHLYVPESQLSSVFREDQVRAILSRKEFQALVAKAKAAQQNRPESQQAPVISSAVYQARIEEDRLLADLEIQLSTTRPQAEVDLNITGWNVQSAQLNDQAAILTRQGEGLNTLRLFVPVAGMHTLKLQLATLLKRVGNDQMTTVGLPAAATGELKMTLPAGKFLRLNGVSAARPGTVDQPAGYAIPIGGLKQMEILITDRHQESRSDVLTFASTAFGVRVQPSETTWSARTEIQIFGQSIDRLVFRVPQTLEITHVESEGLESWELMDEPDHPGRVTITLKYRQPFEGNRAVLLQGILSGMPDQPWQVPNLSIAQVTAHTGVVLVEHAANVRLQTLESQGVRAMSAPAGPGASAAQGLERLYYAVWQEEFALKFATTLKSQQVQAALTNLLMADEQGLNLLSTVSLQTRQVPLFDARLRLPANYRLLSATRDGAKISWDLVPMDAGINEVRIQLNPPLHPGASTTIAVQSQAVPESWPVRQTPVLVAIPEVRLPQADMVEALYGISAPDDLDVVPQDLAGLDPAAKQDLQILNDKLQSLGVSARLGFTYQDTVFKGQLQFSRKPILFTAETLTYFRVDKETVVTHLEGNLLISGGGIRELTVQMSEFAGDKIRFRLVPVGGNGQLAQLVEQIPGEVVNGLRSWKLSLDRYLQGSALLMTEVQLARTEAAASFSPPQIIFPQATVQSGYLAIEGPPDQQVQATAQSADGQSLVSVDPVDIPEGHYHPQERIVAGYHFVRPDWSVTVNTKEFLRSPIPSAVGHSVLLKSVWNPGSALQHQARYVFTAYGMQNLVVQLPDQAVLWSTVLDGVAIEARKVNAGLQIPLVNLKQVPEHTLEIVYETPGQRPASQGELRTQPPILSMISGTGEMQPLTILKQHWDLYYPQETLLTGSTGIFRPAGLFWSDTLFGLMRNKLPLRSPKEMATTALVLLVLILGLVGMCRLFQMVGQSNSRGPLIVLLSILGLALLYSLLLPVTQNVREASSRTRGHMDFPAAEVPPMVSVPPPANHMLINESDLKDELKRDRSGPRDKDSEISGDLAKREVAPAADAPPAPVMTPSAAAKAPVANSPVSKPQDAGLQVGTPMGPAGNAPVEGTEAAKERRQSSLGISTGGLLSMTIGLEIPENSRMRRFDYAGNDDLGDSVSKQPADLQVQYASQTTAFVLIFVITLGILLLGWWLRATPRSVKLLFLFLTLVLPIAILGLIPLLWAIVLQGLLLGGIATLIAWGLVCCPCLSDVRHSPIRRWCQRWGGTCLMLLVAGLLAPAVAFAEETPVPATPPSAVPTRPHVIIPYRSLKEISAADRVYLPAALFKQLWEAGHPEAFTPPEASVPFTLAEAAVTAKLVPHQDYYRARIQFRWVVMNFKESPQTIPLPVKNPGLHSPQLDGQPAILSPLDNGITGIVVPTRGVHIVDAQLDLPDQFFRANDELVLHLLPVPAGLLTLEIPSQVETLNLRVNGVGGIVHKEIVDGATRFQVAIDRGGRLLLRWREAPLRNVVDNNLQLETAILAQIEDAGVRVNHAYDLAVRKGIVHDLTFEVPADLALRQVTGTDVSGWESSAEDGVKRVKVIFTRPLTNQNTQFHIDLFQTHKLLEKSEPVTIQTLTPSGVAREIGMVAVAVPEHLRMQVVEAGDLQQIDVSQFKPQTIPTPGENAPQVAYRFITRPFALKLEVARRDAETRGTVDHGVQIGRRKVLIASRIVLNLTGAPQRVVEVQLPTGYLAMDVVCAHAADWYVVTTDDKQRLIIELDQPRLGSVEIGLEGHLARNPQEESITIHLPAPLQTSRMALRLGVWCDEIYQPVLVESGRWRVVSSPELPPAIQKLRSTSALFAFQATDETTPLTFQLRRATPEISGDAGILIAVGQSTVDYGLTLRWKVTKAAADQFAFTVPNWLGNLELTGPGVRQVQSEPVQNNRTRWIISLIDPVHDQYLVTAAATVAFPTDLTVQTPRLEFETLAEAGGHVPLAVQRQFAVLVNLSQHQLTPADVAQFESIPVDQLPLTLPPALVQQAMEVVRVRTDKIPSWQMQRMEQATGARAVIPNCAFTTILQMDGSWRTRMVLGVRNRGQQFLAVKLPKKSRILSVFVRGEAGRTVETSLGEELVHLVALPQTSAADLSFEVTLLLAGQLEKKLPERFSLVRQQIQLPAVHVISPKDSPDFGVTVAQTVWNVFVPDELDALPVEKNGITNVTFHHEAGWLAAQVQVLDRIRGDVAEMKRIAGSATYFSSSQRVQARNNLKQLQAQLQSDQALGDSRRADDAILRRYRVETDKALSETNQALQELETLGIQLESRPSQQQRAAEQALQQGRAGQGNRAYITLNNSIFSAANAPQEQQKRQLDHEETFNFFDSNDVRRGAVPGKKSSEDQAARSILRQQLQSQTIAPDSRSEKSSPQSSQPNSNLANSNLGMGSRRFDSPTPQPFGGQSFRLEGANLPVPPFGSVDSIFGGPTAPAESDGAMIGRRQSENANRANGRFQPNIEAPFREGGFDLAAPTFGGLDPNSTQATPGQDAQDFFRSNRGPLSGPLGFRFQSKEMFENGESSARQAPTAAGQTNSQLDNENRRSSGAQAVPIQTTTQGLSVAMKLPESGQELSFDKPGGNPALTLAVRPKTTWALLLGGIWCLGCLGLGIWLLRCSRRDRMGVKFVRRLCCLAMLLGGACFILFPTSISGFGFLVFCLSAVTWALLPFVTFRTSRAFAFRHESQT